MRLWPFLLNFKDPASVYAYSLIFVHHQVMWFMILILAVVYWSFFRIIREYSWHSFNRRQGSFYPFVYEKLHFYNFDIVCTQFFFLFTMIWVRFLYLISGSFLRSWVKRNSGFWGYQAWGRLAVTINTIAHGERLFSKSKNHISFVSLLRDKYFYFTSLSQYTPAYTYSSTTDQRREVLDVQSFRENLLLEYVWAIFPSLVIFLILIPSLYLLYSLEERLDPKFHIKVIGHQWFWSYEFDCYDLELSFDYESNLVPEADLEKGAKRLLEVDRRLYLPVNVPLRILVTSSDVLHSWAVPELGIKVDAVPGRLNDAITLIRRPGVFYGQCSELCGVGHGFMPIVVEARSFKQWVDLIKEIE